MGRVRGFLSRSALRDPYKETLDASHSSVCVISVGRLGKSLLIPLLVCFAIGCDGAGTRRGDVFATLEDAKVQKRDTRLLRDLLAERSLAYRSTPRCRVQIDLRGDGISGHVVDPGKQRWSNVRRSDGGGTCQVLHGSGGHVVFELPRGDVPATHLLLRGMSEGFGEVELTLNGEYQGAVDFSETQFETVSIALRSEFVPGLSELIIKRSPLQEAQPRQAGLLLSRIAVGSEDCLESKGLTVWSPREGVFLPEGEAIHFRAFVPAEARIELAARSESGQGALEWGLQSDEEGSARHVELLSPRELATWWGDVDPKFADKAVVISLRARGGDVLVERARLVARRPALPIETPVELPRHLFVVVIDTLRRDHFTGRRAQAAPFAAALRRSSYVFERATAPDSWTKPAMASILSGLHPRRHGAVTHEAVLPADVTLLPEVLAASGWATAAFSTNGYISPRFGFDKGFGEFVSLSGQGRPERAAGAVDAVIDWLSGQRVDSPHMVYLHLVDPHAPYDPPDAFLCTRARAGCPRIPAKTTVELVRAASANKAVVDKESRRLLLRQYAAEVSYADSEVERLYDWLEARGWLRDAVFVLTSDHGEEFAEHGSYGHGQSLHGELTDVPLLVSVSTDVPVSAVIREPFSMVDLMPTLLDLLGVEAPEDIDGVSFFSSHRTPAAWGGAVFSESLSKARVAVTKGRFKLMLDDLFYDLYDLADDPAEVRDVAQRYPIAFGALRDAMASFHNAHPIRAAELTATGGGGGNQTTGSEVVLDEETLGRLRALGYVD